MTTAHVRVGFTVRGCVAEVTPTFDDLLWRTSADPQMQPAIADEIRRARVLDHVERVFVPHVDDSRADLDPAGPRTDGREKGEGGRELLGKVVDTKVCPVRAKPFRRHRQLNGLLQDIARGSRG